MTQSRNQDVFRMAENMFTTVMTTAQGLDTITKEQRVEAFKRASELCFEAATAFYIVANERERES
jgi:hypothetical protein